MKDTSLPKTKERPTMSETLPYPTREERIRLRDAARRYGIQGESPETNITSEDFPFAATFRACIQEPSTRRAPKARKQARAVR